MSIRGAAVAWGLASLCLIVPLVFIGVEAASAGGVVATLVDPELHRLLLNTLALAATVTVFACVLGFPLGILLGGYSFPLNRAIALLAAVPLLIPHHVQTIGWMRVFGRQGWMTEALASLGVTLDVRAAAFPGFWPGPAWIMALALFPLVALPVAAAVTRLDRDAIASATLAGGSSAALRVAVIPAGFTALPGAASLVFALASGAYAVPSLLDTPVLVQRVFFTFSQRSQGEGALLVLPLLVSAALAAALLGDPWFRSGAMGGAGRTTRERVGWLGTAIARFPVLCGVIVPIGALIAKIVEEALRNPSAPSPFKVVFSRTAASFGNGLIFAMLATVVVLLTAWPLARHFAARQGAISERLLTASIALPPLVLGVGTILAWKHVSNVPLLDAIYRSGLILLVLGLAGRFLPIVVRDLRDGLLALDPSAEEAARVAGASGMRRTWGVVIPMMRSSIIACIVIAFTLAITELDLTLLLYPPGMETVQVRIFNMVHYARDAEVSALCLMAVAFAALPVSFYALLRRRKGT